jgi:hypothetical protein
LSLEPAGVVIEGGEAGQGGDLLAGQAGMRINRIRAVGGPMPGTLSIRR